MAWRGVGEFVKWSATLVGLVTGVAALFGLAKGLDIESIAVAAVRAACFTGVIVYCVTAIQLGVPAIRAKQNFVRVLLAAVSLLLVPWLIVVVVHEVPRFLSGEPVKPYSAGGDWAIKDAFWHGAAGLLGLAVASAWVAWRAAMDRRSPDWVPRGLKQCPDCAEYVKEAARVCRYCHYEFYESPIYDAGGEAQVDTSWQADRETS